MMGVNYPPQFDAILSMLKILKGDILSYLSVKCALPRSVAQDLVQDIGKCMLDGVHSTQVGEPIAAVLPNLISKSLGIGAPESTRDAQLGEALSLLVERVSAARSDQRRSESRPSLGSWSSSPTATVTSVVHENPVAASSGGAFAF
eukprot:COSAG04_NODE_9809_length_830_cov_1.824897_1_plen_146_part_00